MLAFVCYTVCEFLSDAPFFGLSLWTQFKLALCACASGWSSTLEPRSKLGDSLVPRPRVGGKSGLASTVCACANDSGNFPRTSPNTDKLHMAVMRRNNQTRYTACSVGAVFTRRSLFIICRLYLTETSLLPRPRTQLSNPSRQPTTSCQL